MSESEEEQDTREEPLPPYEIRFSDLPEPTQKVAIKSKFLPPKV
jgi:hypothetical protein